MKRIFGSGKFRPGREVPPQASFGAVQTNASAPLLVSFTNASVGAQTFLWNFGDGGNSTDNNPTHAYTNAGIYTVALTAANSAGQRTH